MKKLNDMTPKELKELREKKLGMTQQELADALDVKFATVNRWENDKIKIPEDKTQLLECLRELANKSSEPKAEFSMGEIKDAMKQTGAMGVVLAAITAGILTGGLVTALMLRFKWLSGIVGVGGWSMLPYFKKLRKGEKK